MLRKNKSVRIVLLSILVIALAVMFIYNAAADRAEKQQFIHSTCAVLTEKYNRQVSFLEYYADYHGGRAIRVCFEDEPIVSFVSYAQSDNYFESHLIDEAKEMLQNSIQDATVTNFTLTLESIDKYGASFNAPGTSLMEFYQKNKRAISWKDEECKLKIESIALYLTHDYSEQEVQQLLSEVVTLFYDHFDNMSVALFSDTWSHDYKVTSSNKDQIKEYRSTLHFTKFASA